MIKKEQNRFERQMRLFGAEGQAKLAGAKVAVVGVGGLGTHVVQQLALLGVRKLSLVDAQEVDGTNLNRYVGVRYDDPIPGTLKVDVGERIAREVEPSTEVEKVDDSLVSERGYRAVMNADYVFGCLDSEGVRLVLNELCAAYAKPYFDLASDVVPGERPEYGGRVCVAWDGIGCLACLGLLDMEEARAELSGPEARKDVAKIYGVDRQFLGVTGPSVVSINGVVASLGVTEFMAGVSGLRRPFRLLNYYGHLGRMTMNRDEPATDCYYCKGLRGTGERADVHRYIAAGIGKWLR
jgi:molybdopterin-synthase adenylyltransferase